MEVIKLIHKNGLVKDIAGTASFEPNDKVCLSVNLYNLAQAYPNRFIVWCIEDCKKLLAENYIQALSFEEQKIMSFAYKSPYFLPEEIGLIDHSVFLKIKKDVMYPTWLMSGDVGMIYGKTLLHFKSHIKPHKNFDFFLSSLAKQGMSKGLLAYSNPQLLNSSPINLDLKWNTTSLWIYDFIATHYKKKWVFLYELQRHIYNLKGNFIRFVKSCFTSQAQAKIPYLSPLNKVITKPKKQISVDVIIPTWERASFLHQVLKDLALQTVLPNCIIIIEQNPDKSVVTQLDFIFEESWPFKINHKLIHKTGACNARNIALTYVESDWVFFADDDIRISQNFIKDNLSYIDDQSPKAYTVSCLQPQEVEQEKTIIQWPSFGSGCSWVKSSALMGLKFDLAFENGYGEDADFGMQLRNNGIDVLYSPHLKLIHLKAPSGGFRTRINVPWADDKLSPKPAPTVMAYELKHSKKFQLLGYKTLLFIKFYRVNSIKNPVTYVKTMQKRWMLSKKWANHLLKQGHEI